ncbi:Gfo/Idh/MocA family protein [Chloroflexota bacterium]
MAIGWGIIGIGRYADNIIAPAISRATNTKFVAVCSRSMQRAQDFASKYAVEHAYDSLEKMLEDPELDVLYVVTPHSLHAQQTIQAAEAGKHVLCEKPMALTVADAELMIQACNRNKVKLGVCFNGRYHPAHMEAHRYIPSGIVGDISVATARYFRPLFSWQGWRGDPDIGGGGAIMAQALHCIDILRYLLDSEVTEVRSLTDIEPPHRPVDDMVYAILKFDNGARGVVIAGIVVPRSENGVVLYGRKAKIICDETIGSTDDSLGELLVDGDSLNVRMTFPTDEPKLIRNIRAVEAFNTWVEGNSEKYLSDDYNGLQMVRITNAIMESSCQGRAITIMR